MCNAYNHPPGCTCGFGGYTGSGGYVTLPPSWSLHRNRDPVTRPTTCWECGAAVYFYRDENGGCALFDDLGAPWQIHICWEVHRNQHWRAIQHVGRKLKRERYNGRDRPSRYQSVIPPRRSTSIIPLVGIVIDNGLGSERTTRKRFGAVNRGAGAWIQLAVLKKKTVYHVLAPEPFAEMIPENIPLTLEVRWLRRADGMYLIGASIKRHYINGNIRWIRTVDCLRGKQVTCSFCSRRISGSTEWGFDQKYLAECETCSEMRWGRERRHFIDHCRRVASR